MTKWQKFKRSEHYKDWKEWNKVFCGNKLYSLAVLLGIIYSPIFEFYKTRMRIAEYIDKKRSENNG